jgi:hypothetical protein
MWTEFKWLKCRAFVKTLAKSHDPRDARDIEQLRVSQKRVRLLFFSAAKGDNDRKFVGNT